MMRVLFILLILMPPAASWAQTHDRGEVTLGPTGRQLPRYVSLASERTNLRTGPGERYPILWIYVRSGVPLEITAEFENWRRVRDRDGVTGWIHSALLSGQRTAYISGQIRSLYREPSFGSAPVLLVEPGVLADIEKCHQNWCLVDILGREGWIYAEHFWGSYTGEVVE